MPTVCARIGIDAFGRNYIAEKFFAHVLSRGADRGPTSPMSTSVRDGTLIEAWASQKSFSAGKISRQLPQMIPAIRPWNFHGEKRSNEIHQSTTDPDARLARKSGGHGSEVVVLRQRAD